MPIEKGWLKSVILGNFSNYTRFSFCFQLFVALAIAAVVAEPEAEAGAPNPYFGPPYQPNYYANHPTYLHGYYGYPHLLGKNTKDSITFHLVLAQI